jgi:hypothetical protein
MRSHRKVRGESPTLTCCEAGVSRWSSVILLPSEDTTPLRTFRRNLADQYAMWSCPFIVSSFAVLEVCLWLMLPS